MSEVFDPRDRESVVCDLGSTDEDVRRLAVERVTLLSAEEAVPLLTERLGDASWRVRNAAVERIAASPDLELVTPNLLAALGDSENPGRRNAAFAAFVQCGPRMVPALQGATAAADVDVRKFAVDALAAIGHPCATEGLLPLLRDADTNVRAAAAEALASCGDREVADPLLERALDAEEDVSVRFAALTALVALQHPLRAAELTEALDHPQLQAASLELLGRCGDDPDAAPVLRKGLQAPRRRSREAAMRGLLRLLQQRDGAEAEALVREVRAAAESEAGLVADATARLETADPATRLALVHFLGLLHRSDTVLPLLWQARDEALGAAVFETLSALGETAESALDEAWSTLDARAREAACEVLGGTGGRVGEVRLLHGLEDHDPEVRIAAANAVTRRRAASALSILFRRLASVAPEPGATEEVRAVCRAICAVAAPRPGAEAVNQQAIELLRGCLEGARGSLRLAVAGILGRIGRREDTELVTLLLKDPNDRVRRAAVDALARLEPGTAAEPLRLAMADESARVRVAAAVALGASQSGAVVEDLARLAEDDDRWVRAAAVRALGGRFGDSGPADRSAVLAVLTRALEDDALVALGAVEALGEIGGSDALRVASLLERPEPELLGEAIACLGRHADAPALDALLPLVAHPEWSVRAAAMEVLASRGIKRAAPAVLRRLDCEEDAYVRGIVLRTLERLEAG